MKQTIKLFAIVVFMLLLSSCSTKQELKVVHMVSQKKHDTIFMAKLLQDNDNQNRYIKIVKLSKDGKPDEKYGYVKIINKPPLGDDKYIDKNKVEISEMFVDNFGRTYLVGTTSTQDKQVIIWKFSKTGKPDLSYGTDKTLNHILISGLCSDMNKRQITTDKQNNFYIMCGGVEQGEEVLYIRKYDINGKLIDGFGQNGVLVLK
ncbi:MAG: hypothetical protein DRG11_02665 [Epsilonproteobacteria bacterium]|nr:MAG: hypothetical protein DRG11_02665 [Campylobacterota bacterium]